jgi:hypothetical protein
VNPRDRRHKLNDIRSVARELRSTAPVAAEVPDLTSAILGRVDAEKPFLNESTRRCLWLGRAAIGATVALVALSGFMMYRFAPKVMEPVATPAPLSAVLDGVQTKAVQRVEVVQQQWREAPQELGELELARIVPAIKPLVSGELSGAEHQGTLLTAGMVGPMIPPSEAAMREADVQVAKSVQPAQASRSGFATSSAFWVSERSSMNAKPLHVLFARSRLEPIGRGQRANDELFGSMPALLPEHELERGIAPK